ncbi:hypothetical protein CP980_10795 [Streptomyces vinaceus]|uniref:Uncharacterized protein n=1 Tax=Streptomyces vinaceus TaxID=1960 RepID=A0A5J6JCN5_STRVI|nr:hypothetical protein CP980_10795 [Streptomyces vinaceus]GHE31186.1 hypothetical protein GCM10017778_12030 [Streptomyces vinaceus]
MERHELMRLLAGDDAASTAALAALADGAEYDVWDAGTRLSDGHAGTFAIRHRCMQRMGAETLGWERAEELLRERPQPIRIGQITASDRLWVYTFFLTADGRELVACAGVRRADRIPDQ